MAYLLPEHTICIMDPSPSQEADPQCYDGDASETTQLMEKNETKTNAN